MQLNGLRRLVMCAVVVYGGLATAATPPGPGAAKLPDLPRVDGVVTLPMAAEGAIAWRPVRDRVKVHEEKAESGGGTGDDTARGAAKTEPAKRVAVSYTRTRGRAAGVAMAVKEGSLAGLERLEFTIRSPRAQRLWISLRGADGVVWTFPMLNLAANTAVTGPLTAGEIEPDAYQNKGKVTTKFDPARVVMVMILDIGGFMSTTEPACEWTIESMKGVCK